ncbi:MAG: DUF2490 domain-containing protein [Bacteroidetes bacterium]|nr:DUF2490 domain-containing protein [Bacteroidota bacterium]
MKVVGLLRGAGVILFLLTIPVSRSAGQSTTQVWLDYVGNRQVKRNLGFQSEISLRELVSEGEWTKLSVKGVGQYNLKKWLVLIGGLTLQQVWQEPEANTFEIRPFGGGLLDLFVLGNVRILFRSLLELRLVRATDEETFSGSWRWRNRLGVNFPITDKYFINNTLYGIVDVEAFADLADGLDESFASRLRWRAGLGYIFTGFWKIEFIYTLQESRTTTDQVYETSDHILRFRVRHTP